jgi:hypothetical protein
VRPLTWEAYERHCQKYLVPAFGAYPVGGVPVTAINSLYGRLLRAEPPRPALSPSTVVGSTPRCTRRWRTRRAGNSSREMPQRLPTRRELPVQR